MVNLSAAGHPRLARARALLACGIDRRLISRNAKWSSGHVQLELRSVSLDRKQNSFTATAIGSNTPQVSGAVDPLIVPREHHVAREEAYILSG